MCPVIILIVIRSVNVIIRIIILISSIVVRILMIIIVEFFGVKFMNIIFVVFIKLNVQYDNIKFIDRFNVIIEFDVK
jgi:hypothetical protein